MATTRSNTKPLKTVKPIAPIAQRLKVTWLIWPYALLISSMFTLVYLGASGVVLFTRIYGSSWAEIAVYLMDFLLLLAINVWLFILLKRLPSMNNVVKKPRQ